MNVPKKKRAKGNLPPDREYAQDVPVARYAAVDGDTIVQVAASGPRFAADHDLVLVEGLDPEPGIGWVRDADGWTAPDEPEQED